MILEIHDNEPGNTLAGRVNDIDYDYQAEQWVQDIEEPLDAPYPTVRYVLLDEQGERAVWERDGNTITLVRRSPRFTGDWQVGTKFEKKGPS
jgi:hypothetical protein